jgi:hypothetical protein
MRSIFLKEQLVPVKGPSTRDPAIYRYEFLYLIVFLRTLLGKCLDHITPDTAKPYTKEKRYQKG